MDNFVVWEVMSPGGGAGASVKPGWCPGWGEATTSDAPVSPHSPPRAGYRILYIGEETDGEEADGGAQQDGAIKAAAKATKECGQFGSLRQ